jgi:hypothetical protein
LASVGSGTKIEHIEIVSCADDNIEIFGGTVNLKYCTTLFGNDDMYDYDLGWNGKAQFLFGMKAPHVASATAQNPYVGQDNDNGFECDGGDNGQLATLSNPTIYNATIIGNAKTTPTADNRALSAANFKDGAKGTLNNSVFAGFVNGVCLTNSAVGTGSAHNSWHNWTNESVSQDAAQSLKVKCNTFIGINATSSVNPNTVTGAITYNPHNTNANAPGVEPLGASGAGATQFITTDKNILMTEAAAETAGFKYAFAINGATNAMTTKNDVVPNTGITQFQLGSGCPQGATVDPFFSVANYRGAFAPSNNNESWLSDWSYSQVLNATKGVVACPTDFNKDGVTNVTDFLQFSGQFGYPCE